MGNLITFNTNFLSLFNFNRLKILFSYSFIIFVLEVIFLTLEIPYSSHTLRTYDSVHTTMYFIEVFYVHDDPLFSHFPVWICNVVNKRKDQFIDLYSIIYECVLFYFHVFHTEHCGKIETVRRKSKGTKIGHFNVHMFQCCVLVLLSFHF